MITANFDNHRRQRSAAQPLLGRNHHVGRPRKLHQYQRPQVSQIRQKGPPGFALRQTILNPKYRPAATAKLSYNKSCCCCLCPARSKNLGQSHL